MLKQFSMATLCLLCHTATAGTIYKCNEGGRVSYHDRPCGRSAVALAVPDASAAAPEAQRRLARERALLQQIEDERAEQAQRAERAARGAERAQRTAALQQRRCDKLRLQRKWADEDTARAGRDEGERARIKARRQAEVLAVECPP